MWVSGSQSVCDLALWSGWRLKRRFCCDGLALLVAAAPPTVYAIIVSIKEIVQSLNNIRIIFFWQCVQSPEMSHYVADRHGGLSTMGDVHWAPSTGTSREPPPQHCFRSILLRCGDCQILWSWRFRGTPWWFHDAIFHMMLRLVTFCVNPISRMRSTKHYVIMINSRSATKKVLEKLFSSPKNDVHNVVGVSKMDTQAR